MQHLHLCISQNFISTIFLVERCVLFALGQLVYSRFKFLMGSRILTFKTPFQIRNHDNIRLCKAFTTGVNVKLLIICVIDSSDLRWGDEKFLPFKPDFVGITFDVRKTSTITWFHIS